MKRVIFNRETTKLELHFSREEYAALTETQKSALKSNFLWSKYANAWVSRAKEPNLYWARKVSNDLGFENEERRGERLTFAEQLENKQERAEARADRYECYAENAEKRAAVLQKPINDMHGDIAFFTQPNINSSAGRAFRNRREKMFAQYDRGFEEYRKSEHFKDRADAARKTAKANELSDIGFLNRRVREQQKNIRDTEKVIISLEDNLFKIESGKEIKNYKGEIVTADEIKERLEYRLELLGVYMDKENFYQSCIDDLGGIQFSSANIKAGYIVIVKRWGECEILSTGPVNVTYRILSIKNGGCPLTDPYACIERIVKAVEKTEPIGNPYSVGEVLTKDYLSGSVWKAFIITKVTEKTVQLQEIEVVDGVPQPDKTKENAAPFMRKVTKSKFSDFVGVYDDQWQLHKYNAEGSK